MVAVVVVGEALLGTVVHAGRWPCDAPNHSMSVCWFCFWFAAAHSSDPPPAAGAQRLYPSTETQPPHVVVVQCPKCKQHLNPPAGVPIFACPCGQRMRAPSNAQLTQLRAQAAATAAAAAASGSSMDTIAKCPWCATFVRGTVLCIPFPPAAAQCW